SLLDPNLGYDRDLANKLLQHQVWLWFQSQQGFTDALNTFRKSKYFKGRLKAKLDEYATLEFAGTVALNMGAYLLESSNPKHILIVPKSLKRRALKPAL